MKLLYVQPDSIGVFNGHMQMLVNQAKSSSSTIDVINLRYEPRVANLPSKPVYMQAFFDELIRAERDAYDAVIMGCYADPGVREGKSLVRIPVLGAMQLGIHAASLLGKRICVLAPADKEGRRRRHLSWHWDHVHMYGIRPEIATFRKVPLDRPSTEEVHRLLVEGRDRELPELIIDPHRMSVQGVASSIIRRAIDEDDVDVVLPACTLWGGMGLQMKRCFGIPVVDPVYSIVRLAEALVQSS